MPWFLLSYTPTRAMTTHLEYGEHQHAAAQRCGATDHAMRVQVQRRGETLCGIVRATTTFDDGTQAFKVATAIGNVWAPAVKVRLCGATDGRCTCEG